MTFGMQSELFLSTAILHVGQSQNLALSHRLQAVQCAVHLYMLLRHGPVAENMHDSAPHAIYRVLILITELRPSFSDEST